MKCPVCKTEDLALTQLETNLLAKECPVCKGHWLSAKQYWSWLEQHGPTLPEKTEEAGTLTVAEHQHAKLCPECRLIMLRYQVGHGLSFAIDQCSGCAGLWFDQNEWETLKACNLHDEVNRMLTAPWQSQVRKDEARRHLEAIYAQRFGSDYAEIKRIKAWLDAHPERLNILAFFNDPHPFDK
jgi:Zn-finger nucleic acid-binding protein